MDLWRHAKTTGSPLSSVSFSSNFLPSILSSPENLTRNYIYIVSINLRMKSMPFIQHFSPAKHTLRSNTIVNAFIFQMNINIKDTTLQANSIFRFWNFELNNWFHNKNTITKSLREMRVNKTPNVISSVGLCINVYHHTNIMIIRLNCIQISTTSKNQTNKTHADYRK